MRLFPRIGDIIAANLNDLVDRFEDPEVMLKQAIREMETMIEAATGGAARAIAGERLLARDLADHERKAGAGVPGRSRPCRTATTTWPARRSRARTSTRPWPAHCVEQRCLGRADGPGPSRARSAP